MKICKKMLSLVLAFALMAVSLSVGFLAVAASTVDIETGEVNGKGYILGDVLLSTDFESETVGTLPSGWEMNSASFGYNGGGTATAAVEEYGSYGKVLTFASTGIDTWMSMPEINTRDYVYETTMVVGAGTTAGSSFGIANGMYGGISSASGATYTVIYVQSYADNTSSHYRSKGSPSVTKENFTTPIATPAGTVVNLKFVSLNGRNHLYINDTYISSYAQGDSDSLSDWAGFFVYRGTFYITEVTVTEIVDTKLVLNNVTLDVNDGVDLNVDLSFDKNNKVFKNNISGEYAYSDTAAIKFGILSAVSDSSAPLEITADSDGVTDYLFKTNTYDASKLYFKYTVDSISSENLDKYYIFRPYVLIGDNYFYSDAQSYCPASIANNIYSLSSDDMKAKLTSAFADSNVFKGENAKTLTFSLFSDFHYKQGMYIQRVADLETILENAVDNSADFVLSGGDFCNDFAGSPELINTFLNYKRSDGSTLPVYNIYGNHELETTGNTMENVTPSLTNDVNVVWGTEDGSFDYNIGYYYFESNGFRIVCTDTNYSYDSTNAVWEHNEPASYGNPDGNTNNNSLGPTQLAWLEEVLTDAANKDIPCIVVSHHGFSGEFSTSCYDSTAIRAIYARVNAINAGTVLMSINGHHHTDHQGFVDGVFYLDTNTTRNGYYDGGQSSSSYHYASDATYLYEEYDEEGNLIDSYQKKVNDLWMSHFTWWFDEPVFSMVTIDEFGKVTIDGTETEWLYGLEPPTTDPGVTPSITSGTFWDCDSLGHIWSSEWEYNDEYHWHACTNPACSIDNVSLNNSHALHTFEEIKSDEFLVKGSDSYYYKSCECGTVSDEMFGDGEVPVSLLTWDGSIADSFASGSGTDTDPYIIKNGAQLAYMLFFGMTYTGKYYKLANDIYLNDISKADWKTDSPNSWYDRENDMNKVAFVGNLDGAGYTIHGLYYNGTGIASLLPQASNTTITNLRISNADITTSSSVAALISFGQNVITMRRCIVDETVNITTTGSDKGAAGFVGYGSPKIYIYDSAVMATITAPDFYGAFIGNCWHGGNGGAADRIINDSFSAVNAPMTGHNNNSITVVNSYNIGTELSTMAYATSVNKLESADLMKGTAAKTNMPNLNWKGVWTTTENGYPILRSTNGVKGAVWSTGVAESFAGGGGTQTNPFLIETPEQLAYMLNYGITTTGKYYKLTADIYLNDVSNADWASNSPNSWYGDTDLGSAFFSGNLNGAGYTIHGLYYNGSDYAALFPRAKATTITNLRISNANIKSSSAVAALVAFTTDSNTVSFNKCVVDETVTLESTSNRGIGGFVGRGNATIIIENSAVMATLTADSYKGAFFGNCWWATGNSRVIKNSFSAVDAPMTGHTNNTIIPTNCYNVGTELSTMDYAALINKLDSADMMKGTAAKDNMPLLSWNDMWFTTDGYPTPFGTPVACDHTAEKDYILKASTYFVSGTKNVICDDCGKIIKADAVVACDIVNPATFTIVLNPATNKLTVTWKYGTALATDIANANACSLKINYSIGSKNITVVPEEIGDEGGEAIIEGINATRFAETLSFGIVLTVDAYDALTLDAKDVVINDIIDENGDKYAEYNALVGTINTVSEAVVEGEANNNEHFDAGTSKVDIKNATAEIKFVINDKWIDVIKTNGSIGRSVTLVVTIGNDVHRVSLEKLMSNFTVRISGLSFEQMYGDISAQLVIEYADEAITDIITETVTFSFTNGIIASENEAAKALEALFTNN